MSGSLESLVVYKHGLFVLKKRHISSNAAPISTVPFHVSGTVNLRGNPINWAALESTPALACGIP